MIFSNSTRETYYLLSYLLRSFDISILQDIMKKKRILEDKDNLEWYLSEGIKYDKLTENLKINRILFNPYHESYQSLKMYHRKIFHLKILVETFANKGFILNRTNGEYKVPSLKEHSNVLNHFVREFGILEIYNKIFQYEINLTDLLGNRCIRSIIMSDDDYEYQTIAIRGSEFIDPIERLPSLI